LVLDPASVWILEQVDEEDATRGTSSSADNPQAGSSDCSDRLDHSDCDAGTSGMILITSYVDDLLITVLDEDLISEVKDQFSAEFVMKDLGLCSTILGIELEQCMG
ncbi:hypothetical protein IWW52_003717, partial [Coemansia sp. RSA 2704]